MVIVKKKEINIKVNLKFLKNKSLLVNIIMKIYLK